MSIDWNQVIFKGLTIKGIYGREMYETWHKMKMMVMGDLDISPIITHQFHIDDYQEAFEVACSGQSGKVLLNWE
jgi:threonine 3-dehydrogenase